MFALKDTVRETRSLSTFSGGLLDNAARFVLLAVGIAVGLARGGADFWGINALISQCLEARRLYLGNAAPNSMLATRRAAVSLVERLQAANTCCRVRG